MKSGILLESGKYHYDPFEHHGPTLYYVTVPVLRMFGIRSFADSEMIHYRLVPVFFGLLCMALLWPLRQALGGAAMLWTALFMTVSHAMTYYSRYYVQEILLICFAQAALAAGWRYLRAPGTGWALALGICLGLVHATKETSALIAAAILAAMALAMAHTRIRDRQTPGQLRETFLPESTAAHGAWVCLAALLVSLTLFSSFFTHLRGPLDSLLTYTHYAERVQGAGSAAIHDKPWHYYLSLLGSTFRQAGPRWTEAPVLLAALAGMVAILWEPMPADTAEHAQARQAVLFRRFLLSYAVILTVIYAIIPYKTPWNLLPFYHPMLLVAGIGAAAVAPPGRRLLVRLPLGMLLAAGVILMARQNYQGNYVYPADTRNPYVYAHPGTPLRRLITRIDDITAIAKEERAMHINIIRPDGDYWPLPWYLRRHSRVGWWHTLPERPDASMILAAPELYEPLSELLRDKYQVEFHALRPGVLIHAYIRDDLWEAFMQTRR